MRRVRSRSRGQASSLFAFQDIMASVIGVLFFIVLLMAMNITSVAATNSIPVAKVDQEDSSEPIEKLEKQIKVLREEISISSKSLQALGAGDSQILIEIRKSEQQLKSQIDKLIKAEAEMDKATGKLSIAKTNSKTTAEQLKKARKRHETIKKENKTKYQPNVSYIIDASLTGNRLKPWLVVLSARKVRVLTMGGHNDINFVNSPQIAASKAFLAWARSQNPRTHYFVLLIKPSIAIYNLYKIKNGLKSRSFEIGTDLIPEGWQPGLQGGDN